MLTILVKVLGAGLLSAIVMLPDAPPRTPGTPPAAAQASESVNELAGLVAKLHGGWRGQGPCDGSITFRADGTYERRLHGPGGANSAGTWSVRWDVLPPTLVLKCKISDDPIYAGQTLEVKLVQLDDVTFAIKYENQTPSQFVRDKKQD